MKRIQLTGAKNYVMGNPNRNRVQGVVFRSHAESGDPLVYDVEDNVAAWLMAQRTSRGGIMFQEYVEVKPGKVEEAPPPPPIFDGPADDAEDTSVLGEVESVVANVEAVDDSNATVEV